ncbi:MAG: alpha/beta hydrolase [Acidobacteriota bacterium]
MAEAEPTRSGHVEHAGHRFWWELHSTGEAAGDGEGGDGQREVVVLFNGLAMHTGAWTTVLPELTPSYDVVLFDYLGQGRSSAPDTRYAIPDFADALSRILDRLGSRGLRTAAVHTVGISYGAFVALDFARRHPTRVATQTLSGVVLSHERQFAMYRDLSMRFFRGDAGSFELYTHYLYEKIFGESFLRAVGAERLEALRGGFYERYCDRVHCLVRLTEAQDAFFAALDVNLSAYARIETPTLLAVGAQDRAIPLWQQVRLLEILPDCRLEIVAEAGHVVHLERCAELFALLRAFFAARATTFDRPPSATG